MVDRSYLPFKLAREYEDRGMAKWAGFFLTEHTKALLDDDIIDLSYKMSVEELMFLINNCYINKTKIILYTNKRKDPYLGYILDIFNENIYFKTKDETIKLIFDNIIRIEEDYEK